MYTGYELSEQSRNALAKIFKPKYPEFLGHHITKKFGTNNPDDVPEQPKTAQVVGYADDGEGIEGLLVEIDGVSKRDNNSLFHITWSLDRSKGYKPVDTNKIIKNATRLNNPIDIKVTPKLFTNSTSTELKKDKTLRDFVENSLTNL